MPTTATTTASSTYEQLKTIVAPKLEAYTTDLTTHDQNTLKGYTGPFVYGYRKTGTNLLQLNPSIKAAIKESYLKSLQNLPLNEAVEQLQKEIANQVIYLTYSNTSFLYFDGHKFKTVTSETAAGLFLEYSKNICKKLHAQNLAYGRIVKLF